MKEDGNEDDKGDGNVEVITDLRPVLAILVSLVGAFLIWRSKGNPNLRDSWTIITAIVKFLIVISMLPVILRGDVLEYVFWQVLPGIEIAFKVDAFGLFFAITASFLWILTSFYSIGYMRSLNEHAQTRYFICFAISLSAAMGIAFAANLLTMFIFYEVLTIITYPLVIHTQNKESIWAGKKYLAYLLGTSIIFQLLAIVATYAVANTLEFQPGGFLAGNGGSDTVLTIIFILFILGFTKAAIMPLHSWLPTAMIAPTPVSALLHAVAVVKAGVFTILRIVFFVFGPGLMSSLNLGIVLAYVASFTILMASIFAMTMDNLKMRLAYSTVSQLSYIVLGAAMLTPSGITGGVFNMVVHAFSKITLFFCAGAIFVASGKKKISEMNGIGKKMPITMLAFSVGALSMVGLPPTSGFLTKWYLALGSIEMGQLLLLVVIILSAILNAIYFFPVIYTAFFKELPKGESPERKEAPLFVLVPLVLTAIATVILFLAPSFYMELVNMVVDSVLGGS
jgi:multicomponent Na+:H+ antiporter subunit D